MSGSNTVKSLASERVVSVSDPPRLEILSRNAIVLFVERYRQHAGQVEEIGLTPATPQSFVKKSLLSSFEFIDKDKVAAEADVFLEFLLTTFAHDISESVTLSRLEKIHMKFVSIGGLVEYASEVRDVIENSKLSGDSQVVRKSFRKNLHSVIRDECKARLLVNPKTTLQEEFEVAMTVLTEFLTFRAQFAGREKSSGISSSQPEKQQLTKKDVSEKKFSRITPQERQNIVKAGGCTYCRVLDHSNSNCPKIAEKEGRTKVKLEETGETKNPHHGYELRSRAKPVSVVSAKDDEDDGLSFVKFKFNEDEYDCLLDTGAAVNLIDSSILTDKNVLIPVD
ncbi:MAG: hypothetical protein P1Q69_15625, partial [Candidatus Thorarchaeota archaeon]|nr:hypothetical protein [Candidatus Thorarchaeota archaeon]